MQHAQLQEIEVGAARQLPLDRFEAVDLALDRSSAPRILEGCRYCRRLLAQAHGKAAQLRDAIPLCLR